MQVFGCKAVRHYFRIGGETVKRLNTENWKIRVLKSDRNELRFHCHSGLVTVLYKNSAGLKVLYELAKQHNKTAMLAISAEYHKQRLQGA